MASYSNRTLEPGCTVFSACEIRVVSRAAARGGRRRAQGRHRRSFAALAQLGGGPSCSRARRSAPDAAPRLPAGRGAHRQGAQGGGRWLPRAHQQAQARERAARPRAARPGLPAMRQGRRRPDAPSRGRPTRPPAAAPADHPGRRAVPLQGDPEVALPAPALADRLPALQVPAGVWRGRRRAQAEGAALPAHAAEAAAAAAAATA
jgi:hypothetical protein